MKRVVHAVASAKRSYSACRFLCTRLEDAFATQLVSPNNVIRMTASWVGTLATMVQHPSTEDTFSIGTTNPSTSQLSTPKLLLRQFCRGRFEMHYTILVVIVFEFVFVELCFIYIRKRCLRVGKCNRSSSRRKDM